MAKQISLTKYGFVHNHNKDFTNGGIRFDAYELPGQPYLTAIKGSCNGRIYVSITYRRNKFYKNMDRLDDIDRNEAAELLPAIMENVTGPWLNECAEEYKSYIRNNITRLTNQISSMEYELNMLKAELENEEA